MKLSDLIIKKVPATIENEIVEGLFIQPLTVKNFSLLASFQEETTQEQMLENSEKLLLVSLVDEKGKKLFKDRIEFSMTDIMDLAEQVLEINTPKGKSKSAKEEQPNT